MDCRVSTFLTVYVPATRNPTVNVRRHAALMTAADVLRISHLVVIGLFENDIGLCFSLSVIPK